MIPSLNKLHIGKPDRKYSRGSNTKVHQFTDQVGINLVYLSKQRADAVVNVPPDGHCFYHCILALNSQSMAWRTEGTLRFDNTPYTNVWQVRQAIALELSSNRHLYTHWTDDFRIGMNLPPGTAYDYMVDRYARHV